MNRMVIDQPNESYSVVFLTSRPDSPVNKRKMNVKEANIPEELNSDMIQDLKADLDNHYKANGRL